MASGEPDAGAGLVLKQGPLDILRGRGKFMVKGRAMNKISILHVEDDEQDVFFMQRHRSEKLPIVSQAR